MKHNMIQWEAETHIALKEKGRFFHYARTNLNFVCLTSPWGMHLFSLFALAFNERGLLVSQRLDSTQKHPACDI